MVTGVPLFKAGRTRGQAPHAVRLKAGEERRFPGEKPMSFQQEEGQQTGRRPRAQGSFLNRSFYWFLPALFSYSTYNTFSSK